MFRKLMILLLVIFFMALVVFTAVMFLTNEEEIYAEDGVVLAIDKPTFLTLSEPETTESGTDITYTRNMTMLGVDVGDYTLVERTLDNGTTFVFEEVQNTGWIPLAISLNQNGLEGAEVKSWNPEPVPQETDAVYGEDPTSNPFGTIKTDGFETLQGNLYVYRNIELGNGTPVKELRHENALLALEEGVLEKSFWLPPKHSVDTWVMVSGETLFKNEATEDEWIDFALNNPAQRLNWLTPEEPVVKLPLTDDPRTQLAYGYLEERTADPASAEWNRTAPSVFFESMVQNAEINTK